MENDLASASAVLEYEKFRRILCIEVNQGKWFQVKWNTYFQERDRISHMHTQHLFKLNSYLTT